MDNTRRPVGTTAQRGRSASDGQRTHVNRDAARRTADPKTARPAGRTQSGSSYRHETESRRAEQRRSTAAARTYSHTQDHRKPGAYKVSKKKKKGFAAAVKHILRKLYLGGHNLLSWFQSRTRMVQYLVCLVPIGVLAVLLIVAVASRSKKTTVAMPDQETIALEDAAVQDGETGWDLYEGDEEEFSISGEYGDEEDSAPDDSAPADDGQEPTGEAIRPELTEVAFTERFEEGFSGEIVSVLQARLMELGYMDQDETTQYFGPLTKTALKTFQAHNGLDSDGICGEQTYTLLTCGDAKKYVMQEGDSGVDVQEVQQRLYELGFIDNKANITGNFGEKTTEAARLFQKRNKLTVDGKIGEKSLAMLYDEDVNGNAFNIGDEAPVIKQCQQKLYELGYISSRANVKGVFNKTTRSAIKSFQRANGLTVDGALGPITRDAILSDSASSKSLSIGDSGSDVKAAQKRLIALNYLKSGNDSGYYGDLTAAAVSAFQKRNGLSASGSLNTHTLKKLNSSGAKKASSPVTKTSSSGSGSSGSKTSSGSGGGGSVPDVSNKSGAEKAIAIAESRIGCTYVRGAKGPNSFDCSGFVYYCLKNAGVSCSYMTSSQWASTSKYSRISSLSSAKRGDVLVFTGHVGLYLGSGKMIDASSSDGKVRKSSSVLTPGSYWQNNFICAYRVF